jgi:hypothetical protein
MAEYRTVLLMVKDAVNVDSINSVVVKFEMKEWAMFHEFTLINNTWWTKESVTSLYSSVKKSK